MESSPKMRRTFGALNAREKEFVVALTVTGTVNQVKNAFQEQSKWQRSSRLIKAIRLDYIQSGSFLFKANHYWNLKTRTGRPANRLSQQISLATT
jgi:hypothetical protein